MAKGGWTAGGNRHNAESCVTIRIMKSGTLEIPASVLSSVETLDELQDWLTAQHPDLMAELLQARREDLAGEFKAWKPRHLPVPTESK